MAFRVQAVRQPDMGQILRDSVGMYGQIKGIQQKDIDRDIQDKERFTKESSQFAAVIKDLPTDQKLSATQRRIDDLKERGISTEATQRLYDMYASGNPAVIDQANQAINERNQLGIQRGYVKAPEKEKDPSRTNTYKQLVEEGYSPEAPEFQQELHRRNTLKKGPQTIVYAGDQLETPMESDRKQDRKNTSDRNNKYYNTTTSEAKSARAQNLKIDAMAMMDVNTGALEPYKQKLAEYVTALGGDGSRIANISAGQSFNAIKSQLVQEVLSAQSGTKTDDDAKRAMDQIVSMNNSGQANKFITGIAKAQNDRKIEQEDFLDSYTDEHGNLNGAKKAWKKHIKNVPMISKNMKTAEGLPMFYNDFERDMREEHPEATRKQIIAAWKGHDKAAKGKKKSDGPAMPERRPLPSLSINARQQPQQNPDPYGIGGTGQNRLNRQQLGL